MTLKPYTTGSGKQPERGHSREKVLYVEDDDSVWEVTEFGLRSEYDLRRARNARAAFRELSTQDFGLILMDIELQGSEMNGIEICRALRGHATDRIPQFAMGIERHEIPIVFVTAYSSRYSRDELIAAGGDERIQKPVNLTRLSLAMSRLIVRRINSDRQ